MTATGRNQFISTVQANVPVCRDHYRLVLRLGEFPPTAAGQFVQVCCRPLEVNYTIDREVAWEPGQVFDIHGSELMGPLAMLRRPFSLAGRRDVAGGVELEIMHRIVGVGTRWMSQLKPGDTLHLLGPLGNHFEPPGAHEVAILIGGGVGIPPMLYLAEALAGRRAIAFCGALNRDLLPLTVTADSPPPTAEAIEPLYNIDEFARHGIPAIITTDDGSYGFHGLVTTALERYLDRFFPPVPASPRPRVPVSSPSSPILYTCGPEPMMKRVAMIAAARNIPCQISVERAMACGMGTCQSCVIRVKRPTANGHKPWVYKLACTDGPVFRADDLLW